MEGTLTVLFLRQPGSLLGAIGRGALVFGAALLVWFLALGVALALEVVDTSGGFMALGVPMGAVFLGSLVATFMLAIGAESGAAGDDDQFRKRTRVPKA